MTPTTPPHPPGSAALTSPAAPAVPPAPARRLLEHLTGSLPRRAGRPAPGRPLDTPGARHAADVTGDDAFWWEVVRGTAPLGSLGGTVPAPAVAPEAPAPAPAGAAVPVAPVVPVDRPALARADGWLTARSAAVGATAAWTAAVTAPPARSATVTAPPAPAVPSPARPPAAPAAVLDRFGSPLPELLLGDGRRVTLTTTLLVGRNPAPRAGEAVGGLVAVEDPARSVSKTHLVVGTDASGVWVVDRHSTNGTVVTLPDGQQILAVPERRVRLVSGAAVRFGDHGFTLVAGGERS